MRISFLHTMESNEAVFGLAASKAGWSPDQIRHVVRADLRQAMEQQAPSSGGAHKLVHGVLRELASDADAVIVTCATLGPAVDTMAASPCRFIRADAALAEAASRSGKKLAVLCAVESSIAPNRTLFERYAANTGASVTVQLVPGAWALYQEGKHAACMSTCAQAAGQAHADGYDVVIYAHPWMAGAEGLAGNECRPMHGAKAALDAVRTAGA
ncbi:arylsulfatase [Achromobacter aloeverae]|uniref:Arylsulfatase n=1 Tax=Achromobacter aloeverae TaxID=1750518 RepID=A0A4V1MSI3_9BURK|nr:arylsulfatase [Achromobacter aloeverae]RXN91679.1 arylsulfatase [Achromobacter aloeverae]